MLSYFKPAFFISTVGLMLGAVIGFIIGGVPGMFLDLESTFILGILESSMSLDNSVIASKLLEGMDPKWQKRYLSWGFPIAAVGMRLIFPILVVAIFSTTNPVTTLMTALYHPAQYASVLTAHQNQINTFGGTFLFLIFATNFMDYEKEEHWIGFLERPMAMLGKMASLPYVLVMLIVGIVSRWIPAAEQGSYFLSGMAGMASFWLIKDGLGAVFGDPEAKAGALVGLGGFLYLEAIDASFSFDGVIGAFAITNNILIIFIGLSMGASVVRCMTLAIVETKMLAELAYVEPGAFFAIGFLSLIMLVRPIFEVPDYITGLVGAVCIGVAVVHSIIENRRSNS